MDKEQTLGEKFVNCKCKICKDYVRYVPGANYKDCEAYKAWEVAYKKKHE